MPALKLELWQLLVFGDKGQVGTVTTFSHLPPFCFDLCEAYVSCCPCCRI